MKAFLIGALLVATSAWALTVSKTETRIDGFQILLIKQSGDPTFLVSYRTYDDQDLMRTIQNQDYWSSLTPSQKTQVNQVINGMYNKVHNENNIPTPTPMPSESPSPSASPSFADVRQE